MSKEWYLMQPPTSTSEFENDCFDDYKDSFKEILNSYIAQTVSLYDKDGTFVKDIRAVIQNCVADTQDTSMRRNILVEINTIHSGMYIKYSDNMWLINSYVDNNGFYEKAAMSICQYKIKWQNDFGKIIERWCYITQASQYNSGVDGRNSKNVLLPSNQNMMQLPYDKDGLTLDGKRVFLDRSDNPIKVYKITRADDLIFSFENGNGVLVFIAARDLFNADKDRSDLMLCDYIENQPIDDIVIKYSGNKDIKCGGNYKTYSVIDEVMWNIECSEKQKDFIEIDVLNSKQCRLKCKKNVSLIGTDFNLIAVNKNGNEIRLKIIITGGL